MATAAALLILAAASGSAPVALECPTLPGQALAYIGIFDGPPEKQADLAPDATMTPSPSKISNVWQLEAGAGGLYVTCSYGAKPAGPYTRTETIRLPDTVARCRADYTTGATPNDLTLTRFSCR